MNRAEPMKAGDEFVVYAERRAAERLYVRITRVAKDRSWADITVRTWAVMWSKRQPLQDGQLPGEPRPHVLTAFDLVDQEADHMAKLNELAAEELAAFRAEVGS